MQTGSETRILLKNPTLVSDITYVDQSHVYKYNVAWLWTCLVCDEVMSNVVSLVAMRKHLVAHDSGKESAFITTKESIRFNTDPKNSKLQPKALHSAHWHINGEHI